MPPTTRRLAAILTLSLAIVGCGGTDEPTAEGTTTTAEDFAPSIDIARPTDEQAAELAAQVEPTYPGVTADQLAGWATDSCYETQQGEERALVLDRLTQRFTGGDRPAPTPEQAGAILDAILSADWCEV